MRKVCTAVMVMALFISLSSGATAQINSEGSLRVIALFAHPDDGDIKMGATAAMMADMGHEVKFLSITNGNAGHHEQGGGKLANRRRAEAREAAQRLGIKQYEVMDIHDGELVPSLENRKKIIRKIREWEADVVIGHRPNDYHPDHRYSGILVKDAAYMVIVPNIVTDVAPLESNPVFLYMEDGFQRPNPFRHDIVVGIDEAYNNRKLDALDAHVSQFYEWLPWTVGMLDQVPEDPQERRDWLYDHRFQPNVEGQVLEGLKRWYGDEAADKFRHAESFEIAEYGHQPSQEDIRAIFPMLEK